MASLGLNELRFQRWHFLLLLNFEIVLVFEIFSHKPFIVLLLMSRDAMTHPKISVGMVLTYFSWEIYTIRIEIEVPSIL